MGSKQPVDTKTGSRATIYLYLADPIFITTDLDRRLQRHCRISDFLGWRSTSSDWDGRWRL